MELVEYEISNLKSILEKVDDNFKRDRQLTLKDKEKIIWRLVYISLLGYEIDFGWLEVLELVSSDIFEFKQCGYIAASTIYKGNLELLRLLINTIKSDLNHCFDVFMSSEKMSDKSIKFRSFSTELRKNSGKNFNIRRQKIKNCLLALNFIGNSPTLDFADNLFIDVKKLAELPVEKQLNDTHFVRSKAICCLTKLFQCCPDRLRVYEWGERLIRYFQFERNADCLISHCILIKNSLKYYLSIENFGSKENAERQLIKGEEDNDKINGKEIIGSNFDSELVKCWEFIAPVIIFTLSRVRLYKEINYWKFHKIPMFWIQVKLIEILQLLPGVKNDHFVNQKINKIMEDIFFDAIHVTKSLTENSSNFSFNTDEIGFQCIVSIAVEMTKYINKVYNKDFPTNINHLMAKFIEGLLYSENKDFISISILLIFESKTNRVIEELIKKNLATLLRFTCSIDEDTTLNLLNIFSYIFNKNNWVFITREILNCVLYKYILNSNRLNIKETAKIKRCLSNYFYPEKDRTLLEEIILSVCYTIRKFSNKNEVSFKAFNVLFQLLEKTLCEPNPGFDELAENTLFQVIDILFDSKVEFESTNLVEKTNESLENVLSIQKYVAIKSYKLLDKLGKFRDNFNPRSGIRWLCFILGEYGQLISNKIPIVQQVEILLILHDTLTVDSDDEQIPLLKSTILLSFTKLYCNSDHDTQNKIYEVLKIGVRDTGNPIDSPEFLNAIIANTQYSATPINGSITPVNRISNNNKSIRHRNQLLNGVFTQRNSSFIADKKLNKYTDDGYCSRNTWLSLCLSNKGSLYNFSQLSISFSNENFKYYSGESTILVKFGKSEKKNRTFKIERISTLSEESKSTTENSNSFSNIFDSTSQNLHVEISSKMSKDINNEDAIEQRVNLICNGPYLNPPMISLLLRVISHSKHEASDLNKIMEEINNENDYSKLIYINFRLPVILTNFMAPTKKMNKSEFEHFWDRLTETSIVGVLIVSSLEVPIYLQLLNFCIYSAFESPDNPNFSNPLEYSGTSTLHLSNRKRIPCMLKITLFENIHHGQSRENKANVSSNEKSAEIKVRSSSLAVAKILKQIISTYLIANSN